MSRLSMATLLLVSLLLATAPRLAVVEAVVVEGLTVGFYNRTCPEAEQVVRDVVTNDYGMDHTIAPGLIRIFFHDCFITVWVRRVHPAGRVSVGRRPGEGVVGERVHPARPADDRRGQGEPRGHVPAHGVVLRHPVVRGARCGGGGGAAELRGARRAARRHALPDGRPAGQLPGAGAHGAAADGAVREPGPVAAGPGDALRRALHRGRALLHVLQPHLRLLQDGGHRPVAGPGVRAAAAEDVPAAQAGRHPAAGAQGELRRAHRGEAGQRLLPGAAGAAEPADLGQHAGAGPADEAAGGAVRQGRRAVPAEVRGGDAEGEQAGRDRQEEQGADQAGLPDGEQGQGGPLDAHPLSQAPQAPHAPDDQLVHPWLPAG
uniref:Plant heme peroxidase family profile domain-containing protein n=1 Tax=Aegilops tauschii subsp. strangulata TaxID=200361 RepID=A0A453RH28_AEGTS